MKLGDVVASQKRDEKSYHPMLARDRHAGEGVLISLQKI